MITTRKNIQTPSGTFEPASFTHIDESHLLYGNYIGVQYVFEDALDKKVLTQAFETLLEECPKLACKLDMKNRSFVRQVNMFINFVDEYSGSIRDYATPGNPQKNRDAFLSEPSRQDVFSGKAPLCTLNLTHFQDGGSILGFAISHVLTDAAGFHLTAKRLGELYSCLQQGGAFNPSSLMLGLTVFDFGTDQAKQKILQNLESAGMKLPLKIKGLFGNIWRALIINVLDKPNKHGREVFFFSSEEVQRLKETVQAESQETWVSTNVALGAHFTQIIAKLQYGDKPKTNAQIGQLIDLRGRYFEEHSKDQENYVGNAIYIYTDDAKFLEGFQNISRGRIAGFLKNSLSRLNKNFLNDRLNLTEDCLRLGYTYLGLDMKNPVIALNNQSKMQVYETRFEGHDLLRIIPQDVGDHIMFFPTPDGGIEIYLRDLLKPARQKQLLEPHWQERIFDF